MEAISIYLSDDVDSELATTFYTDAKARAAIVVEAIPELLDFEEELVHSTIDLSYYNYVKSDSATIFFPDANARVAIIVEEVLALVDFE